MGEDPKFTTGSEQLSGDGSVEWGSGGWDDIASSQDITFENGTARPGAAIPDSAFAHYDATKLSYSDGESVSTWSDHLGDLDLTAGTAPTYRTSGINGIESVEFDGSSTSLDVSFSSRSQPLTVFLVVQTNSSSTTQVAFSDVTDNVLEVQQGIGSDGVDRIYAGSILAGGSTDTNPTILTSVFDGGSSAIRIDGAETVGDAGTGGLDGILVGNNGNQNWYDGYIGEIVPCDARVSDSDIQSEEQRLADRWGISLA